MTEEALVEAFIRNSASPNGKWWVEVPVGFSVEQDRTSSVKYIDAVCLSSHPQQLPESYPDYQGTREFVNSDNPESGVTRAELFHRLSESEYFTDEKACIVEAKTGKSSFKAIGQLEAYKTLLEEDYSWTVEEQILVSKERDPIIDHVCNSLGIRIVAVR